MKATAASFVLVFGCALTFGQSSTPRLTYVNPEGLRKNPRFTQMIGVEGGKLWIISGQAGAEGGAGGAADFRTQVTRAFENLKTALNAAGLDFSNVIRLNSYIVNLPANIAVYRDVRVQYVHGEKVPTSTTVGVQALATEGALVEIDAMAVAPADASARTVSEVATGPAGVMVTSILRAHPGMQAELREQLLRRVEVSRKEPGCLTYELHPSSEDPLLFMLHETWTDQASLDRHFQTPDHQAWQRVRSKYVAERHVYFWKPAE